MKYRHLSLFVTDYLMSIIFCKTKSDNIKQMIIIIGDLYKKSNNI